MSSRRSSVLGAWQQSGRKEQGLKLYLDGSFGTRVTTIGPMTSHYQENLMRFFRATRKWSLFMVAFGTDTIARLADPSQLREGPFGA
jgi:hypothetical protein